MSVGIKKRYEDLTIASAEKIDLICQRFERDWKISSARNIQGYVQEAPDNLAHIVMQELVQLDVAYRRKQGELAPLAQYREGFREVETWLDSQIKEDPIESHSTQVLEGLTEFEILSEVGRGGMGVVYRAFDHALERPVAIKILLPEAVHCKHRLARFYREARVISGLNHPNICTIYAIREWKNTPFLVLEWIDGKTFRSVEFQPLSRSRGEEHVAGIFLQVAKALVVTHRRGIIHRDIKPENLILRPDGYVKVLDFGLARMMEPNEPTSDSTSFDTIQGTMMGTVKYMSPEQTQGDLLDCASDIFSLGIVLYEALTGIHPFSSETPFATMDAIENTDPIAPIDIRPELSIDMSQLIRSMLSKCAKTRPSAEYVHYHLQRMSLKCNLQTLSYC